jgi:hypothetical protein
VHDLEGWCARGILKLNQVGDRFVCVCVQERKGSDKSYIKMLL